MTRRLLPILAILSLLPFLAFATLYLRSYFVRDTLAFARTTGHSHIAQSILGRLHILSTFTGQPASNHLSHSSDRLAPNAIWNGGMSSYPLQVNWRLGFVYQHYTRSRLSLLSSLRPPPTTQHRLIVIPYYYPTALFALPPAFLLYRLLRHRSRTQSGLCPTCSYDLRASKDRCPECGSPIPASS